jgi:hypothetical protein
MIENSHIKGFFHKQFQNDSYYYTMFVRYVNQIGFSANVFYNKLNNKVFVFEKFQEGFSFFPHYWCNEYALSTSHVYGDQRGINASVLDEENRKKLEAFQEDDNPFIIKYYFK